MDGAPDLCWRLCLGGKEVVVDEFVAEFSVGVVLFDEFAEGWELFVVGFETGWRDGEDLGPVGAGIEGCECCFDAGEDGVDGCGFGLPGEVDGHGVALVGGAHPEVVGGDGAQLGDEEVWRDVVA